MWEGVEVMVRKAPGNDTVDVTVQLRSDPDKHGAYCVFDGKEKELWVPKSLSEIERDDNGKTWTLTVATWFAEKWGLI